MDQHLEHFRQLAAVPFDCAGATARFEREIRLAVQIREVEQTFLDLFDQGRMNGTVHTCVGQEFSAVAIAGSLRQGDWITSNHRCHGHFVAHTGQWAELIDELRGLACGVCKGVGSSQHLFAEGFLSNGPQAALVPVATGIALHHQRNNNANLSVSFIGEGTLGEGVLYEAMNLASCLQVPQLIVCENNLYSQSTPQSHAVAGSITARAEAFGLRVFEADTWDLERLMRVAEEALSYVRENACPAFLRVRTYRLNAHSKGDDDRNPDEVAYFRGQDRLNMLLETDHWQQVRAQVREQIDTHLKQGPQDILDFATYAVDQLPRSENVQPSEVRNEKIRLVKALNRSYAQAAADGAYLIGEDIADPYGGAFKVTRGISQQYPQQVISTPISEAGLTGLSIGLAMMGNGAYAEIMFGDFVPHIFDQLMSNASKFHHMYAHQISAPLRVRTPMGGKRGYGPTHSQSLEKYLVGIDNVAVIALSSLEDPHSTLRALQRLSCPAVIIENKVDYGKFLWQGKDDYITQKLGGPLGTLSISPRQSQPNATLLSYGGTARELADGLDTLFFETDVLAQLLVPTQLHPLHMAPILDSLSVTGFLIVVEDGSTDFGLGAEIAARASQAMPGLRIVRIGAQPVPVPSVSALEALALPTLENVIDTLRPRPEALPYREALA